MEATPLPNWIEDQNRFKLPAPPAWALKKLYDFDPMLVIIPSRNNPVLGENPQYLLTRRAHFSAGLGKDAVMENKHPDTWMCMTLGLVPIAPLRWKSKDQTWRERDVELLIAELRRRDTWAAADAVGGVDKLVDEIEAAEERREAKERAELKDSFYHRGRDAWRSMQARIGARSKRASDYHGAARPR